MPVYKNSYFYTTLSYSLQSMNKTLQNIEIPNWGLYLELEKEYPNLFIEQIQNSELSKTVLAPGDSQNVVTIRVTVKGNIEDSFIDILIKIGDEYKLTYCYCSVYGECWKVTGRDNLTKSSDCKIRSGLVN